MRFLTPKAASVTLPPAGSLEGRYRLLLEGRCADSAHWLAEQLERADGLSDDLPSSPSVLAHWSAQAASRTAHDYAAYLEARRQGESRRFFANRSQALYFLQQVAPTKAVDGAWLQGTLRHWRDPRFHGLIRTYLEELGDGDPRSNHVLVYQRLLSRLGCLEPVPLTDERYLQGCLQLALGLNTEAFLPEVVGYNLGYEQPPLHLLVTTYELAELGIDAHYFRLHVTIDNAASGHAQKSVQALQLLCPPADEQDFYRRVARGYRLNDLGVATATLIAGFDLQAELLATLERKRSFGQCMHSDQCSLQGRTINQWLAMPGNMAGFLQALQAQGWVKRDQDPAHSRFWALVEGPTAPMFGIFSPYERQLWHDWIAGIWQAPPQRRLPPGRWETDDRLPPSTDSQPLPTNIDALIDHMTGNRHALPDGLRATQAYARLTGLAPGRPC
ncbi:iron-containing redox enzyme family protein [Pseudomonas sp. X10]